MTRREEVLRTATELLAARLASSSIGSDISQKEVCTAMVTLAEHLLAEVDRWHPTSSGRGGPDDR